MIVWKKMSVDNEADWILVDESNDTDIIASMTVSKNPDGNYNALAVCKKIGYTCSFEHLSKDRLKTAVNDLKIAVKVELNHLSERNQKPIDKKIYKMIDSMPVWAHLKNGSEKNNINLKATDYGYFAEILGNRVLNDFLQRGEILKDVFPGIEIIATHFVKNFKILERAKIGLGDIVIEVDYKKGGIFGKKMVVLEIKHGKIMIEQNQLRRYCSMILNPGEHFKKADEVKIVYMMFDKIDTMKAAASYSIQEVDKDFAEKILGQETAGEEIYNP